MEGTEPMTNKHFTLTAVKALPPSTLELTYADGAVLQVDLKPIIRKHRTLARLADAAVFTTAQLGEWAAA
jgi:hypothetical protein